MSFSCQNCRKTRRKCDRGKPTCARCIKYKIDCVYELPPKHKIKQSVDIGNDMISETQRQQKLHRKQNSVRSSVITPQLHQRQLQRPNESSLPGISHVPLVSHFTPKNTSQFDLNFLQTSSAVPSGGPMDVGLNMSVSLGQSLPLATQISSQSPGSGPDSATSSAMSSSSAPLPSVSASFSSPGNISNMSRHPLLSHHGYQNQHHQQHQNHHNNNNNNNNNNINGDENGNTDNLRYEQTHKVHENDPEFVHTSFAEYDLRARFETTNEFYSYVIKDPFYHYFLVSQILTGSKLIKLDPANSSLWFSCILEASNALQPLSVEGIVDKIRNERSDSPTKLIDDMLSLLPPQDKMRTILSHFYTNVHGPYPILDVNEFEQLYQMIIEQRQYYYDLQTSLKFLTTLMMALRLGYLSLFSYFTKFEPNHASFKWCLQYPIEDQHLKCLSHCIHFLKDNEQLQVQTLILFRLMLLLEDHDDMYSVFGWSDGELCKMINDMGVAIRDEDSNMWMLVCWNNLHYMLLCGAVHDQFDNSVFYDDAHLLDDSQTLEEIISLDDIGKHNLEIKHILKKGYQLFKLIISNRNMERTLDDEQFIQFKINENNGLNLFKLTQPSYEFSIEQEQEIEILPGVPINISIFNDFNKFKWGYFFKVKKLSNQSLLFFHFERTQSPLFWSHLFFTLTAAVEIAKSFVMGLQSLRLMKTPSKFVVSHVICLVTNRTLAVLFGLIIRFLYFKLNCRDPELAALVREILLKLFSILKDVVNCADIDIYRPRTVGMARNLIELFNLGKLELSLTSYLNSSKEELQQYHSNTVQNSSWSAHVKLSPPSNLKTYSKMIMTMTAYNAKEVLNVLSLYDKDQSLFDGF